MSSGGIVSFCVYVHLPSSVSRQLEHIVLVHYREVKEVKNFHFLILDTVEDLILSY